MAVGIDIGTRSIKVVRLRVSGRKARLQSFHVEDIPEDEDRASAVQGVLERMFRQHRIPRNEVAVGLPPNVCIIRQLVIPFTRPDQIRKTIKFQAEPFFYDCSIDDAIVDFQRIGERGGQSRLLVAGVKKPLVAERLQVFRAVGVEPVAIDVHAFALAGAYDWAGAVEAEDATLIVDFGHRNCHFVVLEGGRVRLARSVRLALVAAPLAEGGEETEGADEGQDLIDDIESGRLPVVVIDDDENLDFLEGEPEGEQEEEEEAGPRNPVQHFYRRLFVEADRTLGAAGVERPLARILVTGGGSSLPGLEVRFAEHFGIDAERFDFASAFGHARGSDADALNLVGATALGLALKSTGQVGWGVNFRQEDFHFQRRFDDLKRGLAATAALMFLVFFIFAFFFKVEIERKEARLNEQLLKYQAIIWQDVFPDTPVPRSKDFPQQIRNQMVVLQERLGQRKGVNIVSALDVLRCLATAKDVAKLDFHVSGITITQDRGSISCWSEREFGPYPYEVALNETELVDDAQVSSARRERDQFRFQVDFRPKKQEGP